MNLSLLKRQPPQRMLSDADRFTAYGLFSIWGRVRRENILQTLGQCSALHMTCVSRAFFSTISIHTQINSALYTIRAYECNPT